MDLTLRFAAAQIRAVRLVAETSIREILHGDVLN